MKEVDDLALSDAFRERYLVGRVLGQGGVGRVLLARDTRLERDVAIKLLRAAALVDKEDLLRFQEEARVCARLAHPNIVALLDVDDDLGNPYLVFEFVDGSDLGKLLETRGAHPVDVVMKYAKGILEGLACAHEQNIVHRDLKPANIMIRQDGDRPMIADFGLALLCEGRDFKTKTGLIVGTPLYMAPEQIMAEEVGIPADIYSVGCMLYECFAGRPPFEAATEIGILHKHLEETVPPLQQRAPAVGPHVAQLIHQCLHKEAARRPVSARALWDQLEGARRKVGESGRAGRLSGKRPSRTDGSAPVRVTGKSLPSTPSLTVVNQAAPSRVVGPGRSRWVAGAVSLICLIVVALFVALPASTPAPIDFEVEFEAQGDTQGLGRIRWRSERPYEAGVQWSQVGLDHPSAIQAEGAERIEHRLEIAKVPLGRDLQLSLHRGAGRPFWSTVIRPSVARLAVASPERLRIDLVTREDLRATVLRGGREVGNVHEKKLSVGKRTFEVLLPLVGGSANPMDPWTIEVAGLDGTRLRLPVLGDPSLFMAAVTLRSYDVARVVRDVFRKRYDPHLNRYLGYNLPQRRNPDGFFRDTIRESMKAGGGWAIYETLKNSRKSPLSDSSISEAIRVALYEGLLQIEPLDWLIRGQHDPVRLDIAQLYKDHVRMSYEAPSVRYPPFVPSVSGMSLMTNALPLFWVPENFNQWPRIDLWRETTNQLARIRPDVSTTVQASVAHVRGLFQQRRTFGPIRLPDHLRKGTLMLESDVAFLSPQYGMRVVFRGTRAGAPWTHTVLLTQAGTEDWVLAMDGMVPRAIATLGFQAGTETPYVNDYYGGALQWGRVRAHFAASLLPDNPVQVDVNLHTFRGVSYDKISAEARGALMGLLALAPDPGIP